MELKSITQILSICGIAVFTGVMLNIGLTLGSYWKSLPPAEFLEWFGVNSHFIARTIPLYTVPTLVAVITAIWMNWEHDSVRNLWLLSLLCMAGIAAITFAWHLPTNAVFVSNQIATDDVPALLNQWLQFHAARIILSCAACVIGIIAMLK